MASRKALYIVTAATTLVGAIATLVAVIVLTTQPDRTTKEELFEAASKPDAAAQYDYFFSEEELNQIEPSIDPYNCREPEGRLSSQEEYKCGVDTAIMLSRNEFVPYGYMYSSAWYTKHGEGKLAGIRVVKTIAWRPGLTAEPSLQPKSPEVGPLPSGKSPVSSPSR